MTTGRINQVTTVETPAGPEGSTSLIPSTATPERARRERDRSSYVILEGTGNRGRLSPARPGTMIDLREEVIVPRPSNCPH
jgi:hypothetical protein